MKTLTINIPEGYIIDNFDKQSGEITLKENPKKVTDRIMSVLDVLNDNGLSHEQFKKQSEGLSEDEVAYKILKLLAKSLNEGWQPNWNNTNEAKYYAWFEMGGSSGFRFGGCAYWLSYSLVGSRLCFKSRELAEHAGKNFTDVYKQFMTIN